MTKWKCHGESCDCGNEICTLNDPYNSTPTLCPFHSKHEPKWVKVCEHCGK